MSISGEEEGEGEPGVINIVAVSKTLLQIELKRQKTDNKEKGSFRVQSSDLRLRNLTVFLKFHLYNLNWSHFYVGACHYVYINSTTAKR